MWFFAKKRGLEYFMSHPWPWQLVHRCQSRFFTCTQGDEKTWLYEFWLPFWFAQTPQQQDEIKRRAPNQAWVGWIEDQSTGQANLQEFRDQQWFQYLQDLQNLFSEGQQWPWIVAQGYDPDIFRCTQGYEEYWSHNLWAPFWLVQTPQERDEIKKMAPDPGWVAWLERSSGNWPSGPQEYRESRYASSLRTVQYLFNVPTAPPFCKVFLQSLRSNLRRPMEPKSKLLMILCGAILGLSWFCLAFGVLP